MNQRVEQRLNKSLLAYVDGDGSDLLGVISNISKNGLFIETHSTLLPESEISFVLAVYSELYSLKGEVRWAKHPGDTFPGEIPTGMGIRITEAPVEYLNYVEFVKYQMRQSSHLTH
jgi:hypothetical protein